MPDVVVMDNGPQFKSQDFHNFACDWEFEHHVDLLKSILDWRNTPTIDMDSSPTQRLMSRRTRYLLPLSQDVLQPKLVDDVMHKVKYKRQKAKMYYDRKAKDLPELEIGQTVRVNPKTDPEKKWRYGTCVETLTKRSYLVDVNNKR